MKVLDCFIKEDIKYLVVEKNTFQLKKKKISNYHCLAENKVFAFNSEDLLDIEPVCNLKENTVKFFFELKCDRIIKENK